jgi:hypothetical protein
MSSAHNRDAGTSASVLRKRYRDDEDGEEDENKENRSPKHQKSEWDSSDDEPVAESTDPTSPVPIWRPEGKRYVRLQSASPNRRPREVLAREGILRVYVLFILVGFFIYQTSEQVAITDQVAKQVAIT